MSGEAFESYIAPARARPALWRLVVGMALGTGVYMGVVLAIFALAARMIGADSTLTTFESGDFLQMPRPTLVMLLTFLGMALGAVVAARALHRRGPGSLIGPLGKSLRHFGVATLVALVVYMPGVAAWNLFFEPVPNMEPRLWLTLLPLTLGALLIQTLAEELVFRGYLMQQLAARFRSKLIWFWLPALVFGAIHYDPAKAGDNALLLIISPMVFGILAADLTVRTGSLGAAWGFHFANNFVALALLSTKGTITGLALFLTPYSAKDMGDIIPLLASDMVLMLAAWFILRRIFERRR